MKNNLSLVLAGAIVLLTFLASCNPAALNNKADDTATDFYQKLQKKNFNAAADLCSIKAFAKDSRKDWVAALERNSGLLGDLKSFTKVSSFNIASSLATGTTVVVAYDVQWQYGKTRDSITLIKDKDGSMKLYNYRWKGSDAAYIKEVEKSEVMADKYMSAIEADNYDAALAYCSEEAFKITSKDGWKVFLDKAKDKYGPVSGYDVLRDSSYYHIDGTGESGKGNYYDVYVKTNRNGNDVIEKIVFFQKNYEYPVKLVGHFFN